MHKLAFQLGPIRVHWYGVLLALGFLAGLWTASRRARLTGLAPEKVLDLGPWLIIGALLGARTVYVLSYWEESFAGKPIWNIFKIHEGGLVFYGGLIGATLAAIIYLISRKLPLWQYGDALAPSIALGSFFGRLGCLMNGCCFGRACDLPWAIQFPQGHPSYPATVHPTQIYDALLNLGLYGLLAWLYRRKRFDGQIFALFLVGYALLRSVVEWFRGDYSHYYWGGNFTQAHVISLAILAAGIILYRTLARKPKRQ